MENFNGDVAIMMKMWDTATSNQGWRGLASFVGTMNRHVIGKVITNGITNGKLQMKNVVDFFILTTFSKNKI